MAQVPLAASRLGVRIEEDEDGSRQDAETQRDWWREAERKLDEVRELVRQTEKPYEPHVPDWDEWQPPKYVNVFEPGQVVGYHCRNEEIEALQQVIDAKLPAS